MTRMERAPLVVATRPHVTRAGSLAARILIVGAVLACDATAGLLALVSLAAGLFGGTQGRCFVGALCATYGRPWLGWLMLLASATIAAVTVWLNLRSFRGTLRSRLLALAMLTAFLSGVWMLSLLLGRLTR